MKTTKPKSRVIALLLLLTLGFLGAHRIYLGQYQYAFYISAMTVLTPFVGFPVLVLIPWLVIDLIAIAFKLTRDAKGIPLN